MPCKWLIKKTIDKRERPCPQLMEKRKFLSMVKPPERCLLMANQEYMEANGWSTKRSLCQWSINKREALSMACQLLINNVWRPTVNWQERGNPVNVWSMRERPCPQSVEKAKRGIDEQSCQWLIDNRCPIKVDQESKWARGRTTVDGHTNNQRKKPQTNKVVSGSSHWWWQPKKEKWLPFAMIMLTTKRRNYSSSQCWLLSMRK